jgi:hypothetical protein
MHKRRCCENLAKPELMLVTDGEDDTGGLNRDMFAGLKLHVVLIHCRGQSRLLRIADETGGVGINIRRDMF